MCAAGSSWAPFTVRQAASMVHVAVEGRGGLTACVGLSTWHGGLGQRAALTACSS